MARLQEIWIWVGINLVFALTLHFINAQVADDAWHFELYRVFSTLIVALNVYRMYAAEHLVPLYGLALVLNHLALFLTESYSFFASFLIIMDLVFGG